MAVESSEDVYTEQPGRVASALASLFGQPSTDDLELEDGEDLRAVVPANRTQNRRRAVGGTLFLTTGRLVFLPHDFDAALSGDGREVALEAVGDVGVEPPVRSVRGFLAAPLATLFGGGLTDRLRVEVDDGGVELFVCGDPAALADRIEDVR